MEEKSEMIIYGTTWCGDCYRIRRFLDKHAIGYCWINIDKDTAGEETVLKINNGMRSVPTIVFDDGSVLVEPSNAILAQKLGIPIS